MFIQTLWFKTDGFSPFVFTCLANFPFDIATYVMSTTAQNLLPDPMPAKQHWSWLDLKMSRWLLTYMPLCTIATLNMFGYKTLWASAQSFLINHCSFSSLKYVYRSVERCQYVLAPFQNLKFLHCWSLGLRSQILASSVFKPISFSASTTVYVFAKTYWFSLPQLLRAPFHLSGLQLRLRSPAFLVIVLKLFLPGWGWQIREIIG